MVNEPFIIRPWLMMRARAPPSRLILRRVLESALRQNALDAAKDFFIDREKSLLNMICTLHSAPPTELSSSCFFE